MSYDNKNILAYIHQNPFNSKALRASLLGVARLVIRRHYSSAIGDMDMESMAVTKGLLLLNSNHVKQSGDLFNFLYSGMRNELGNYLKREKRGYEIRLSEPPYFKQHGASYQIKASPAMETLREGVKTITDRVKQVGLDLSEEVEEFFDTLDYTKLGDYGIFAVEASAIRAIIG